LTTAVQTEPVRTVPALPAKVTAGISVGLDLVADLALLGFASWTVIYHVGLIFDIRTDPLLVVWVASLIGAAWYLGRRPERGRVRPAPVAASAPPERRVLAVSVVLAAASALLIFLGPKAMWWPGWLLALASVVAAFLATRERRRRAGDEAAGDEATGEPEPVRPVSLIGTYLAALTGVGLGVLSLFVVHGDADDVFYVNRASWIAEHGTIPVKDTLFTNEAIDAIRGAGVPVSSIEAFQGAVAHAFGFTGGTAAYYLTPPVAVFVAVWTMWRLIRAWAPRRRTLAFAVAMIYLLWEAQESASAGSFFILRMQQGKAIFASWLVPALFLYLTRWVNRSGRREAVLLAGAGATAVGLTSSATFLVPLLCGAAVIPLLLARRFHLAWGALLPFAYPLVVGVVVHFSYSALDPNGVSYTGEQAFRLVMGVHWFGAIGWLGVLCGLWLVRRNGAQVVASGVPVVMLIVTAPGVFALMNDLTGAHAVLWRAIWIAPVPALVGVAASVPLPSANRLAAPVPAVVLALAIIASGLPLWRGADVSFASRPTWRYGPKVTAQGWAVIHASPRNAVVLAPYPTMRAIALATTRVHVTDPRDSYRDLIDEPAANRAARAVLARIVFGHVPPVKQVRSALRQLDVRVVCLEPEWENRRNAVRKAGYRPLGRVGSQVCFRPAR
jgi:hypothetical protein